MALKAGTVGIDPKYVDKNGKPVSDVDLSNYYTKSETDGKLDLKANKSYLTANNKIFNFAYDAESGKYGYKAGAQDEFHPFESAGAGSPGWNKPATLISTGFTSSRCTLSEGGYYEDTANGLCYIDMVCVSTSGSIISISGLPRLPQSVQSNLFVGVADTQAEAAAINYDTGIVGRNYIYDNGESYKGNISMGGVIASGKYFHIMGTYPLRTE